jgi:hypothetical protein
MRAIIERVAGEVLDQKSKRIGTNLRGAGNSRFGGVMTPSRMT